MKKLAEYTSLNKIIFIIKLNKISVSQIRYKYKLLIIIFLILINIKINYYIILTNIYVYNYWYQNVCKNCTFRNRFVVDFCQFQ